ncbi:MAG: hypothetical protein COZ80_07740 [Ignavibacteria bacterium CG_4_8_14_3_um_filter_37_9]|nr:hypothetical protein [Ignavibacteria bacterium]OIO19062.1 MAG: hypothetical protein AUJ54_06980 [Ignavibacteria bacterium CG1_02_37_35]PIP79137.1 MAG: hypothetical protein COW85_02155 [Ignavibacteria bacterium CG22_combo_CG10-13_8_21_14_all_37_15]PIS44601.1 MAG: hypothetical protein COT22_09680 [Ignavibacteria bacterium CG08_land_8_20_14_0_20_37_9]PIW98992.1 MAG: hypothetical protein COZ80_07740 [Ignavibacteria bacterium CG_4_8_14_3_um_filter_37_9]PIX95406.1 MAG: hypothetical protein COZ25_
MKKIFFMVLVSVISLQAQWEVRGSMGLNIVSMPDLKDYLNTNFFIGNDRLSDFTPAVETGIEVGYQLEEHFQVACELSYEYNSFSYPVINSSFAYNLLQPSLLGYYTVNGKGYQFKFGGGIGPRFIFASEPSIYTTALLKYTSTGYGLVGKIDGITSLGGNYFAYIGVDLRYNNNGNLSDANGKEKINNVTNTVLSLNSVSAGLKVGVAVTF